MHVAEPNEFKAQQSKKERNCSYCGNHLCFYIKISGNDCSYDCGNHLSFFFFYICNEENILYPCCIAPTMVITVTYLFDEKD